MPISLTLTRVVWATLPVTVGPATVTALGDHSTPVRVVVTVWIVMVWIAALVALVLPRPFGLTTLRVAAPVPVALALWALVSGSPGVGIGALALLAGALALVLVLGAELAIWCVEGSAYGDERRFPLRTPPALLVSLVPAAVGALAAGTLLGPLLLAAGRWIPGIAALLVGGPLAYGSFRSLHLLSRRFLVLVPAGVVVADPMTLTDPFLFVRDHVLALVAIPTGPPPADALDLRLGAAYGSVALRLDGDAPLTLRRRTTAVPAAARTVLIAPLRRSALLTAAEARRLRVER